MLYTTYCISICENTKRDEPKELVSLNFTANHGDMLQMVSNAVATGYNVEIWTTKDEKPHCTHPDYVDEDGVPNFLRRL